MVYASTDSRGIQSSRRIASSAGLKDSGTFRRTTFKGCVGGSRRAAASLNATTDIVGPSGLSIRLGGIEGMGGFGLFK